MKHRENKTNRKKHTTKNKSKIKIIMRRVGPCMNGAWLVGAGSDGLNFFL